MSDTLQLRSFSFAPATLSKNDDGTATVDAVLSSGAAVTRKGPGGFFQEVLDVSAGAVKPAAHVALLDSHRQGSFRDIVGHVRGIRFEPGAVVATLVLSNPDVIAAVARGDLRGVSVGYRVLETKDSKDARGGLVRTATSWALMECSLVAIPADSLSTLRSKPTMATETEEPVVMTRAQTNAEIRTLAKRAGLPATWSDEMIDTEVELDAARAAAAEAMIARSEKANIRTHVPGQVESRAGDWNMAARSIALAHRQDPGAVKLTEAANEYRHFSMQDHMRDALELAGIRTRGMSRPELISRVMDLSTRASTTSDFPNLLLDFSRRLLEPRFQAAQSPFGLMFNKRNAIDKRAVTRIFLSEMPQLLALTESGEIQSGGRIESATSYALKTAARQFGLTRDALLNDDLGAFSDAIGAFSAAAGEYVNQQRVALLAQNSGAGPNMSDGLAMFATSHGNISGTGAAISVATLSAAQEAMYLQTSLDAYTPVNVKPQYLMVGPANILTAQQVLHTLNPTQLADVNPFAGNALTLLIEPRLKTSNSWYVFAAPGSHTSFEESYLEGAEGPQIETKAGWSTLGVDFRCYIDYNAGAIDWRGAYLNVG